MPANTIPIFSRLGDVQWGAANLNSANTAKDGTGTVTTIFTADSSNGGYVEKVMFSSAGTNVATVGRIFINNGSSNTVAANNILFAEITLSATTVSEVSAQPPYIIPMNVALPAGFKVNCTLGTTISAGYFISAVGGKY